MSNSDSKNKSGNKRNLLLSPLSEKKITVVGLTGVMGAGKSSVIEILKEAGVPVIDCDSINEQLQQKGQAGYQEIVNRYGASILQANQMINKQKLSQIIFHDMKQKQWLESVLHPLIKDAIKQWLNTVQGNIAVVEVPLLLEIHWETYFDEIWVVSCDKEILLERLANYRHITKEEASLRLAHQLSQSEKEDKADYILYNNTTKEDLKQQILELLPKG